jgi:hypothetical protein
MTFSWVPRPLLLNLSAEREFDGRLRFILLYVRSSTDCGTEWCGEIDHSPTPAEIGIGRCRIHHCGPACLGAVPICSEAAPSFGAFDVGG